MMNEFVQFNPPVWSCLQKIKSFLFTGIFFLLSNGLLFIAMPPVAQSYDR
jgi:hypothetical protein